MTEKETVTRERATASRRARMLKDQAKERKAGRRTRRMTGMRMRKTKRAKERRAIKATTCSTSLSKLTMVS